MQSLGSSLGPQTGLRSSAPHAVGNAMRDEYRILVTASRTWKNPALMWQWLDYHSLWAMDNGYREVVVIHGDADGGDQIAKLWGEVTTGAMQFPVPADWAAACIARCAPHHRKQRRDGSWYCPAQGMYRNERMIGLKPVVVGAFIHSNSSGAVGCAALAVAAGIRVDRFDG